MSKKREMQRLIRAYKDETRERELDMHKVAKWAVGKGWTLPKPSDPMEVLAREFTTAAREEIEYDKHTGRPYRVYHALKISTWRHSTPFFRGHRGSHADPDASVSCKST